MPRELFLTDWSPETLAGTLFVESDVDIAVHHRLRLDSLFTDGLCAQRKNVECVGRWPARFLTYAGVNPLEGVDACLADLRRQVAELPDTIGVKLYPDAGSPDRSWRLDDPQYAPLFDLIKELGLKIVAVHKVVPERVGTAGAVPDRRPGNGGHQAPRVDVRDRAWRHATVRRRGGDGADATAQRVRQPGDHVSAAAGRVRAGARRAGAVLRSGRLPEDHLLVGAMHFHPQPIIELWPASPSRRPCSIGTASNR